MNDISIKHNLHLCICPDLYEGMVEWLVVEELAEGHQSRTDNWVSAQDRTSHTQLSRIVLNV